MIFLLILVYTGSVYSHNETPCVCECVYGDGEIDYEQEEFNPKFVLILTIILGAIFLFLLGVLIYIVFFDKKSKDRLPYYIGV